MGSPWTCGAKSVFDLSVFPRNHHGCPRLRHRTDGNHFLSSCRCFLLDDVLADEPEPKGRVRELLHEIMVDELAHIGQRKNFMGNISTKLYKKMVGPIMRMFFKDIPEAKHLFDVDQMVKDALAFDYSRVKPELMERTWVPSYCQTN